MELPDKVKALCTIAWMNGLTESERSELAGLARYQEAPTGTELIAEDAESTDIFAVLSGRIDISITVPGSPRPEVIATLQPGEIFGELILLGRGRRSASAKPREVAQLLVWQKQDLTKLFEKNRNVGFHFMFETAKVLADRLYSTNLALRNSLSRNATARP